MAQLVKPGRTEVKSLGGGEGIQPTVVEGGEDFLDVERRNAAGQLFFFMESVANELRALPPSPRSLSLW